METPMSRPKPRPGLRRIVRPLVAAVAASLLMLWGTQSPAAAALPQGPPALSGGVDGQVYATLVVGSTVYVGGSFTHAQTRAGASVSRSNLAAFDVNSGALLGSWQANADGGVRSLASSGGFLYVGGAFRTIGGLGQQFLARVSLATGAVDTGFRPRVNATVLAVQARGSAVYAGGQFTFSGGVQQQGLARFDATTGAKVAAFTAATNGPVDALSLSPDGTRLAAGGLFTTLSGAGRTGMGLVDPATGAAVGPAFAFSVRPMLSLDWSADGTALFGGSGNSNNLAARWNPTTGARGWHFTVGGDVQAIDFFAGDVYVGFHDNFQNDTQTKLLGVDAQTGAIDPGFRPVFNQFWGVRSISAGPWGLVIGGQFTTLSGVWAHNWARFPAA